MRSLYFYGASLLLAAMATPANAQIFDGCDQRREISHSIEMPAGGQLRLIAGAGSLRVRGVEGLRQARVRGTACANRADVLAELSVEVRRTGNGVHIETHFPTRMMRNTNARIDLVVEVPMYSAARISDGSGSAEIQGLGDLDMEDGSGELIIEDVRGRVTLEDGSGSITIRGVTGDVRVEDGSGEIDVRDVGGTVRISDGSGSIRAREIRGDFLVPSDGSGSLHYDDVRGRVEVPRKRGRSS